MNADVQRLVREGRREQAFEMIVAAYEQKAFRLVYSIVRQVAPAEDITQDAFLKVWLALDAYDGRASVGTWVYAIARNTALNYLRSQSYRQTAPLDSVREPAADAANESTDVRQLVSQLPEEQREVIELFYLQEQSVSDVSEMLDLPEGTVKSHLYRARKTLARLLGAIR